MKLVVVESPSKTKTIKKYLGKGYTILASKGHVADLPKSSLAIDVEKNFEPQYVVTNKKSLSELKKAYKQADELILALDLDREGEAIAWHVATRLGSISPHGKKKDKKGLSRIVFSEISKGSIENALKAPRELNMDLVNAQQSRRVLDRLVGYTLSPILWKKVQFGLSAGRVQSVALRLVVEKEEERDAFNKEEYWSVEVFASDKKAGKKTVEIKYSETDSDSGESTEGTQSNDLDDLIKLDLTKINNKPLKLTTEKDIKKLANLDNVDQLTVKSVEKKVSKRYPKPPFITSTLQQAAVNKFGFTSKRTMQAAQKLYEKGFITYMRTDSLSMSADAVAQSRKYIQKAFGKEYLPEKPNFYKSKSKSSQEAHECIRPVDFSVETDKSFTPEEEKVYKLIRGKALASQMVPAEMEVVAITAVTDNLEFKATGQKVVFPGYLKTGIEKVKEISLPEVKEGLILYSKLIRAVQHFTQPPARYSEASLIKRMEELEIGRPSTYASIISTILSRKYVIKEGRYLIPTDVGKVVTSLLKKYFAGVVDYAFTSDMENNLDSVADGKLNWKDMLKDFYFPFEKQVTTTESKISRDEFTVLRKAPKEIKCPECGSPMVEKLSRFGTFYSCSKFPDCKGMRSKNEKELQELEKLPKDKKFLEWYNPAPKTEDDRDYLLKKGRFGKFWAHPDYPKVKDARPLELKADKLKEVYGDPPKTDEGKQFILRSGKYGEFWAHPNYPKEKKIVKAKRNIEVPI